MDALLEALIAKRLKAFGTMYCSSFSTILRRASEAAQVTMAESVVDFAALREVVWKR